VYVINNIILAYIGVGGEYTFITLSHILLLLINLTYFKYLIVYRKNIENVIFIFLLVRSVYNKNLNG